MGEQTDSLIDRQADDTEVILMCLSTYSDDTKNKICKKNVYFLLTGLPLIPGKPGIPILP